MISNPNGSTHVTTTPNVCTKLEITTTPPITYISTAFCVPQMTKISWTASGENWPRIFWCKNGILQMKIWNVYNDLSTNQRLDHPCKLCNKELGWFIGPFSCFSIIRKDVIWSLTCSCTRSSTSTLSRQPALGFLGKKIAKIRSDSRIICVFYNRK